MTYDLRYLKSCYDHAHGHGFNIYLNHANDKIKYFVMSIIPLNYCSLIVIDEKADADSATNSTVTGRSVAPHRLRVVGRPPRPSGELSTTAAPVVWKKNNGYDFRAFQHLLILFVASLFQYNLQAVGSRNV